ncbi:Arabinanase/levansucrase/invertase [Euphorbia peplus]|nr:Arabinanase/levansucrase/invertase [Euphorbia peplus]
MEVAASKTTINVLITSITQKLTYPVAFIPISPSKNLKFTTLFTSNSFSRTNILCCSHSKNPQNTSTHFSSNSLSSSSGLVFDLGDSNSWDSKEIGSPVVKRFISDEGERWYMWYHGNSGKNPGSDSIGLAVSNNGVHWERGGEAVNSGDDVGLVMKIGEDWWGFDTLSVRPSEVIVMSSSKVRDSSAVYWLYYTGFSSEKVESFEDFDGTFFKSLPGLAMSQDGRHWARIEGEHHSGALFDVGSEKEWDSLFISNPQVVFHGSDDMRMYYHSFDRERGEFGIGIARSRDGINWVKLGKIMSGGKVGSFDEKGVMNASVVRNQKDGSYVMAYEGVCGDGKRSIGLAFSNDGLKDWRRFGEDDDDDGVVKSGEDGWDKNGVGSPCLVQIMEGDVDEWRLYYRGVGDDGRSGIGMAFCLGSDFSSFKRWTSFTYGS